MIQRQRKVSLFSCAFRIQVLNANLAELTAKFEEATAAKLKCQQEAEATQLTISLANRCLQSATLEILMSRL